jgi:hypothetical protein
MNSSLDTTQRLIAQLTGPMHVRFILQPALAIILGIRDGIHDAKEGKPAFLWDLLTNTAGCKGQLKSAVRRLLIPLIVAIVLEAIAQHLLFDQVRILRAVVLGVTIIGLPYSLARGVTNRMVCAHGHTPVATHATKS